MLDRVMIGGPTAQRDAAQDVGLPLRPDRVMCRDKVPDITLQVVGKAAELARPERPTRLSLAVHLALYGFADCGPG